MIDYLAVFITFFAVIDPIGTVPVFIAVTAKYDQKTKRKIALIAALVSSCVLLFFIVIGEVILTALAIPLPAFQISGGIVLFLFALNMIFGDSKPEEELKRLEVSHQETAIFPIAVPSIASPGAMLAAVLLTKNAVYSIWQQVQTALVMLSVLVLVYILMMLSGFISRIIGSGGASVISRVMGMILASIATTNILMGLSDYYKLLEP